MLGTVLENLFIRVWVIMKLNFFFWLYTLAGGIVLGIGPALKVVSELFIKYEFDYREITLKESWLLFKNNFKRGNILFLLTVGMAAFLAYNLFLALQIKGLLFLVIDFMLIFVLLYLFSSFMYALIFDGSYEMTLPQLFRLSFSSSLSNFPSFLKMIIGSAVVLGITWKYKGLILFGTIGMLVIWNFIATKNWRIKIEERIK
ncbi:YesL family protein [Carnobacterium sp.]|uniref:YesL family protein n=1 Tax=Carnobacterium sp. TaxID=48221 RepID=UPI003C73DE75